MVLRTYRFCAGSAGCLEQVYFCPLALETPIEPPSESTISLQIVSPNPVPPYFRLMLESTWENGLKSYSCPSSSMPMPVSLIANRITGRPSDKPSDILRTTAPLIVNLMALLKVDQDLADTHTVGHDGVETWIVPDVGNKRVAMFSRPVAHHLHCPGHQRTDIRRRRADVNPTVFPFSRSREFH